MIDRFLEDVYSGLTLNQETVDAIVKRVSDVEALATMARKEGLVRIEEKAAGMGDECTLELVVRAVDGVPVEDMEAWFRLYYITSGGSPLDRLLELISFVGIKAAAREENPRVIEELLLAMLSEDVRKAVRDKKQREWEEQERVRQAAYQSPYTISEGERKRLDYWQSEESDFTLPGRPEDEHIHRLCSCLERLDDRAIQRVLRETDTLDLIIAMRVWNSRYRKMIFNNMSIRLAAMIAGDLWNLEKISYEDAVEANKKLADIVRKLDDAGEIMMTGGG